VKSFTTEGTEAQSPLPLFSLSLRALCGMAVFLSIGCASIRPPRGVPARTVTIETTGYCKCGQCCGWHRSWIPPFRPVYSSGPNKGKSKKVGITASGTKGHRGTIAADPRYYPFGTVMYVPGYGYGKVEDVGSAIKGRARIDLYFSSHQKALNWGRKRVPVEVWR